VHEGQVKFLTRRGHDWSDRAPKLLATVASLKTHAAILDGEIVVQDARGGSDFNELERELGKKGGSNRLVFYVFDLLYLDGLDLRPATLVERKEVLQLLMAPPDRGAVVQYSEHFTGDGAALHQQTCDMGLEGIVSKRIDARYVSGRTETWIKVPCRRRDTFVIVGYALNGKKFDGFYLGELHDDGDLVYAGKIESG
jgi:bifunctional non-homologous end joining protein LigD